MMWEGTKGRPSTPVMPLDLELRPIVDEKYIIPKTIDYIKRNAAAKKPFYVYMAYSEVHPPMMANPNFAKSPLSAAERLPTSLRKWTTASVRSSTPSRKRA